MGHYRDSGSNVMRYPVLPEDNEGLDIGRVGLRWNSIYAKSATIDTINYTTLNPPGTTSFPLIANPVGTISAPAYSFNADTNTGLYRVGASNVGFTLGGTLIHSFTTTGHAIVSASNQLVLGTAANLCTVTVTPTAARTLTIPDATGTVLIFGAGANTTSITTLGTITTGTWQATIIDTTRGGWGQSMAAANGLPTWNAGTLTLTAVTNGAYIKGGAGNVVTMQAAPIPVADGGTNIASYTAGDLLTATGATTLAKLAKGTANQVLGMNSGNTTQEYKTLASADASITITHTANNIDLKAGAGITVLDTVTSATTVGNTAAETTIYTKSIAGNTIGINGKVWVQINGSISDTSGGLGQGLTLRLKYGVTTLATLLITTGVATIACPPYTGGSIGASHALYITGEMANLGATNSQHAVLLYSGATMVALLSATLFYQAQPKQGTSAEDSTAAKTFLVSAQWSGADAASTLTVKEVKLCLVP